MPSNKVWYQRVNAAWPEKPPALTFPEAARAVRRLWRWAEGEKMFWPIRETSGNRYTWLRGGVFCVNARAGWDRLAHDLSHWFWSRQNPDARPHEREHAKFELRLRKEILRRGYLKGALKDKPQVAADPARAKIEARLNKYDRTFAALKRWESKQKRAETAIKKLRRSLAGQERAMAGGGAYNASKGVH